MSRIGKKPIEIPAGVDVQLDGTLITVKGPKGTLSRNLHPNITVEKDGNVINVTVSYDGKTYTGLKKNGSTYTSEATDADGKTAVSVLSALSNTSHAMRVRPVLPVPLFS